MSIIVCKNRYKLFVPARVLAEKNFGQLKCLGFREISAMYQPSKGGKYRQWSEQKRKCCEVRSTLSSGVAFRRMEKGNRQYLSLECTGMPQLQEYTTTTFEWFDDLVLSKIGTCRIEAWHAYGEGRNLCLHTKYETGVNDLKRRNCFSWESFSSVACLEEELVLGVLWEQSVFIGVKRYWIGCSHNKEQN